MRKRYPLLVFTIILVSTNVVYGTDSVCSLLGQASRYYHGDYDKFWTIFHENESTVLACDSKKETICFLEISEELSINAEFSEYFHEILLDIILKESDCFFQILSKMNLEHQRMILWDVNHSYSEEDDKLILKKFNPLKNDSKYQDIFELFHIMGGVRHPWTDYRLRE